MKRITKAVTTVAAAAALVIAIPAGNAAAINETRCSANDLLRIDTAGYGSLCFANGGTTQMYQIPNVTKVSSGNNKVILRGPGGVYHNIPKWTTRHLSSVTIDYIRIY
ncbi:beta/gamma crystallin domain-containing protein [Streptomyces sp. NPDC004838]